MIKLKPMSEAPLDGTPVILKFKDDLTEYSKDEYWLSSWTSAFFVGKNHGNIMGWCFASPVGHGGIASAWLEGWADLKEIKPYTIEEVGKPTKAWLNALSISELDEVIESLDIISSGYLPSCRTAKTSEKLKVIRKRLWEEKF